MLSGTRNVQILELLLGFVLSLMLIQYIVKVVKQWKSHPKNIRFICSRVLLGQRCIDLHSQAFDEIGKDAEGRLVLLKCGEHSVPKSLQHPMLKIPTNSFSGSNHI